VPRRHSLSRKDVLLIVAAAAAAASSDEDGEVYNCMQTNASVRGSLAF